MARSWIGQKSITGALEKDEIIVHGGAELCRNFDRLLRLSPIVDAARQPPRLEAS